MRILTLVLAAAPSLAGAQSPDPLRARADSLYQAGANAEAEAAYAALVRQDSTTPQLWYRLGVSRHRLGRYADAAPVFERAVSLARRAPGAQMLAAFASYNAAAAHARLGHPDVAFRWLDTAVAKGFLAVPQLEADADFAALRGDPRYAALAERMRRAFAPCAYLPEARRFDFWLGEWDVRTAQGQMAGQSRIEQVSGGCALLENWTDGQGGTGKSLNAYNSSIGMWQQYWVGQQGGVTEYRESTWDGKSLTFLAAGRAPDGKPTRLRLTFTPLGPDIVRQHGEQSTDGGTTWTTTYDLRYHRKPK